MTTRRPRLATLALAPLATALLLAGGCGLFDHDKKPDADAAITASPTRGPAPSYADAARRYNQNVRLLDRVRARANILLAYFDDQGNQRTEDPEGLLQIVRPNKLALSLGKAGQTLFWFGCDPEQYWWIDLSDKSNRLAAVGEHARFTDDTAQRIGLPIKPLDLIRLLGVVPMDVAARGATQWSVDGALLGVTTPVENRGFQRVWVDPDTFRPRTIEIFDLQRSKVLVAEHEGQERVELQRDIPGASLARVLMPSRVLVTHIPTDTTARITLTDCRDGPISDKAFDLKVLLERFPVDHVIDVDARRAPAKPSGSPAAPAPRAPR